MRKTQITFDQVFKIWLDAEVNRIEGRDLLLVAKAKGFTSIAEWRLSTALRFGMDKKDWTLEVIKNPNAVLPKIIIGPYMGWSKFFENRLNTTFAEALEIPEFFNWCKTHDRVVPLSKKFPLPSSIILFKRPDGRLIHVEGGHRICAAAFAQKLGRPVNFKNRPALTAAIAPVTEREIRQLIAFIKQGTAKQAKEG